MTEPKAHYRLTSIEGVRPKGTQRPSPESMEVLRQHLEEAGVPRPKGGRPAMSNFGIKSYAVVKPCISPGTHNFTVNRPPIGTWGQVIILCSRCGMTSSEARND